jgi:Ca-activated chloride channel family protein
MLIFANKIWLWIAIASLPGAFLFFWTVEKTRRMAMKRFGDPKLVAFLSRSVDHSKRRYKHVLWSLGVIFILIALARPQLGTRLEEIKREGIDLVIALDVSNSMLAEDIKPNRLMKAKYEIRRLIDMLQGDRVALVIFAGEAMVQVPLTLDYDAFTMILDNVDQNSIPVQGTAIARAIDVATDAFVSGELKHRAMLLITDGEDHQGKPIEAAANARSKGISIYTVGIGSTAGVPIPLHDANGNQIGVRKDRRGNIVTTRLDAETLQRVALETDGKYLSDLEEITSIISGMETKEFEAKKFTQFEDRFQFPLAIGMVLMIIAFVLPVRRKVAGTLSDFLSEGDE